MGRLIIMSIWIKLFWNFVKIGTFSYGGGYTSISLMEAEIIRKMQWLDYSEFLDVVALSQITPGPVGINAATYTGFKIKGFFGSALSTIGLVFVSFFLVIIVAHYFLQFKESKVMKALLHGLRPAIIGIIITVVINLGKETLIGVKEVFIMLVVVIALVRFDRHPILMIFISGVLGIIIF